jgi:peptidoglycan/xylan/chitin deacetylase (PgdA/CDA1 family)
VSSDGTAIVLAYHRVACVGADPFGLAVSPERFGQHLQMLNEVGRIRPLSEIVSDSADGVLEGLSFAITFDDGYADNVEAAAPALEGHGASASFFVISGYLGGNPFWWDELTELVFRQDERRVLASVSSDEHRRRLLLEAWARCQGMRDEERRAVLEEMRARVRAAPARDIGRSLTYDEVRSLAGHEAFEIGAHTRTHPILALLDENDRLDEMLGSKTALEAALGQPVRAFSYPYGQYDGRTVEIVRRAGFDFACSVGPGVVTNGTDRYRLPRLEVGDWDEMLLRQSLEQVLGAANGRCRPSAD